MASQLRKLLKLFKRKKAPPLACHMTLDQDDNHVHTAACFIDVQPLALVELFQSQGCKACAPAIPSILEATQNPNLQVLTYDVTFFDHLGWKDTYANPRWDERLKNYVKRWGRNTLYTPMVVVGGVADGGSGGGSKLEIDGVVQRARDMTHTRGWHIYLDANDTNVKIDSDKLEIARHDVLVIVYEDKSEVVKIGKGPNKGKKVPHKNVVRDIVKIGEWMGGDMIYDLPVTPSQMAQGTAAVAIVQEPLSGPIVAVTKIL
ncbi:thioredoxin-like protein [Xylariales sp. PMI_506]|nr:thioredoxin-like protein [Xylariales sp. PMI_506]